MPGLNSELLQALVWDSPGDLNHLLFGGGVKREMASRHLNPKVWGTPKPGHFGGNQCFSEKEGSGRTGPLTFSPLVRDPLHALTPLFFRVGAPSNVPIPAFLRVCCIMLSDAHPEGLG